MLFMRREPLRRRERIRIFFLPRSGYRRSFKYLRKRVLRLSGSPHAIAAGLAVGVAASCTPFLGFHFLIALGLAWLLRGNMLAAAIGTTVGNPLTFPFIWLTTYKIGNAILRLWSDHLPPPARGMTDGILAGGWHAIVPLLKPMIVGAIPLALGSALLCYVLVRWGMTVYQGARRERLAARRVARQRPAE